MQIYSDGGLLANATQNGFLSKNATLGRLALHCIKLRSICQKEETPFGCLFFLVLSRGLDSIKCRCPVDICLPPVSTAATQNEAKPR